MTKLVVLLFLLPLASTQTTHYIRPSPESPCPYPECLTLSEYVSNTSRYYNSSDTILQFLPGVHTLNRSIVQIENSHRFALFGSETSLPGTSTVIQCNTSSGMIFVNIRYIVINGMSFHFCGERGAHRSWNFGNITVPLPGNTLPTVSAVDVYNLQITNCKFKESYLPLFSSASIVTIQNTHFQHNIRAVITEFGYITFKGHNWFKNNKLINKDLNISSVFFHFGGAIASFNSELHFLGPVVFQSNSAPDGGAIGAINTTMAFSNSCLFSGNSAKHSGGAISLLRSSITLSDGHIEFTENYIPVLALDPGKVQRVINGEGGAVSMYESTWLSHSSILFSRNYADEGGALFLFTSQVKFENTTNFSFNNVSNGSSNRGGAVYCTDSNLTFTETATFASNLASTWGGAISSYWSELNFKGAIEASGNSASRGGALQFFGSKLTSGKTAQFTNNYADKQLVLANHSVELPYSGNGGVIASDISLITFHGLTYFSNNSADHDGGAIEAYGPGLWFYGETTFDENHSQRDGGAIFGYQQTITFAGRTVFSRNSAAGNGGGLDGEHVAMYSSEKIVFERNYAGGNGGGINLCSAIIDMKKDAHFSANTAGLSGGAVNTAGESSLVCNGTSTYRINSAITGGAISVNGGTCILSGNSTFTHNTGVNGGAIAIQGHDLVLRGVTAFVNNVAKFNGYGGGIHAVRTRINITGYHNFINNSATFGGGIAIMNYDQQTVIYVAANTTTRFTRNYAKRHGAAMLIEDPPTISCNTGLNTLQSFWPCLFQINPNGCNPSEESSLTSDFTETERKFLYDYNAHVYFESNIAKEGGHIFYGGNLDKCGICYKSNYKTSLLAGNATFSFIADLPIEEFAGNVSSEPFQVCSCIQHTHNCSLSTIIRNIYPGQLLTLEAAAVGQVNGAVPGVIHAKINNSQGTEFNHLQRTQTTSAGCSTLEYTVQSKILEATTLTLYAEGPCGPFSTPLSVSVHFLPCPRGFSLSQSGACTCDQRLQKYTNSCDINGITITREGRFWMGFDHHSPVLILHPHCPFDYCKVGSVLLSPNATDHQCAYNRSGKICGACKPGLSLNLGSSRCSQCSNKNLLLILPLAFAGLILVLALFVCKVIIAAGTVNGLIFYVNVIAMNRSLFYPSRETQFLTVFIAWLNLDLGVEVCFFDGMDAYTRTWLQFLFPVYIWILAGVIMLASHYSIRFAKTIGSTNPIAVLATLFLLSYTKLLRTIIATFSFTILDYPNDKTVAVWVYDGNIRFLGGKHIALFLAGLLAFLFLFLPYTLLLVLGQWIEARSNHRLLSWANNAKVRAFLDAYHAPYKNRHRYWVGLLLVVRSVLFVTSAVVDINSPRDPSVNLLVLAITCTALMTWIWNAGSMYKKWYNNALESSFILNLAILAVASNQMKMEGGNQAVVVYTSITIAFMQFLGIIAYHVIDRVATSRLWKHSIAPKLRSFRNCGQEIEMRRGEMETPSTTLSPQVPTTYYVELREPLLESCH